jgi:hypothetical protein
MEKLVIGLSHFWRAHMVYVGWVQHPVSQHNIVYRDYDVPAETEDALTASMIQRCSSPTEYLQMGLTAPTEMHEKDNNGAWLRGMS